MTIIMEPGTQHSATVTAPSCNLCGSGQIRRLYKFSIPQSNGGSALPLAVLRCDSCNLIFLERTEALASAQEQLEHYWQERWGPVYNERQADVHSVTIARCEWLERLVSGRGRLLDMGCGEGSFLAAAKSRGWQVGGIEVSEVAARRAQAKVGDDCIFRSLEAASHLDEFFDVATLWDVIEHLPDPAGILQQLSRVLRRGGYVIVSTPNAGSLLHRLAHWAHRCSFNRWTLPIRLIYLPEHLYYFDSKTLAMTLGRAGFAAVKFESSSDAPAGLFDNLDALFSANQGEGWSRLPLLKPAIAAMLSFSRWLKRPYRLLAVARRKDGSS